MKCALASCIIHRADALHYSSAWCIIHWFDAYLYPLSWCIYIIHQADAYSIKYMHLCIHRVWYDVIIHCMITYKSPHGMIYKIAYSDIIWCIILITMQYIMMSPCGIMWSYIVLYHAYHGMISQAWVSHFDIIHMVTYHVP